MSARPLGCMDHRQQVDGCPYCVVVKQQWDAEPEQARARVEAETVAAIVRYLRIERFDCYAIAEHEIADRIQSGAWKVKS